MPRNGMWEELCCCTVIGLIVAIVLSRLFWKAAIIYPRRSKPTDSQYMPRESMYDRVPGDAVDMVKCQNCGTMYDGRLEGCPGCGGSRAPVASLEID